MSPVHEFLTDTEADLGTQFLQDGCAILPVEDNSALSKIRDAVASAGAAHLELSTPPDPSGFLNGIHDLIDPKKLNDFRISIIASLNAEDWLRPAYFNLARQALHAVVGNEMVMQRRINLSIQLPHDASSLLPVHADVWSGDSPFEVVAWLPLVDCRKTKSMYLLPPESNTDVQSNIAAFKGKSAEELFAAIEKDVTFLDIKFGEILLFSQNLLHGNRINVEPESRWSMNCRFKSLFSPYADKKLGEFFDPITMRPATRLGLSYKLPSGLDE